MICDAIKEDVKSGLCQAQTCILAPTQDWESQKNQSSLMVCLHSLALQCPEARILAEIIKEN